MARIAVKGLRCTTCRKAAPPKVPRPGRLKQNIGQFNDKVLIDLGYVKDSNGVNHGWALMVDEGTDWLVAKYLDKGKTAPELYNKVEEGWIDWAGPPDIMVGDSERGFIAEEFTDKLARAGTLYIPAAGYAPGRRDKLNGKFKVSRALSRKH